jgi:hypothetical protein
LYSTRDILTEQRKEHVACMEDGSVCRETLAAKDQLEFLRLSASMILEICLEGTGCEQVN